MSEKNDQLTNLINHELKEKVIKKYEEMNMDIEEVIHVIFEQAVESNDYRLEPKVEKELEVEFDKEGERRIKGSLDSPEKDALELVKELRARVYE